MESLDLIKHLAALKALKGVLGDVGSENEKEEKSNSKKANDLQAIHTSSRTRICIVADKIAKPQVTALPEILHSERSPKIQIPESDQWDLRFGDRVKIKFSLDKFKYIQNETLGWTKRLATVHGYSGIITDYWNEFENGVQVYFPKIYSSSTVYAGVLEKIPAGEKDSSEASQWKVGDFVKTISDHRIVELLQKHLPDLPSKYIGSVGRVIGVTSVGIFVTYDDRTSFSLNPALLLHAKDEILAAQEITSGRILKFQEGQKVKVASNMKKLIKNQKDKGGWSPRMSTLKGEIAKVVKIDDAGAYNIALKCDRTWRLNEDSLLHLDEEDSVNISDELEHLPSDKVKFKIFENTRALLASKEIPMVFLEYLRLTAIVGMIDDDLEALIRYNSDRHIGIDMAFLCKASPEETEKYDAIEAKVNSLKAGDTVYLDVGPPNYVNAVLAGLGMKSNVIKALCSSATLLGFADTKHAIIQYEDGSMYRIDEKYLTVPEKFHISPLRKGLDLDAVKEIEKIVTNCIKQVHEKEVFKSEYSVRIETVTNGNPPTVALKIQSMIAAPEKVLAMLKKMSEWDIKDLCYGRQLIIKGAATNDEEIKVDLLYNEDDYVSYSARSEVGVVMDRIVEGAEGKLKTEPYGDPDPAPQPETPDIENVQNFSWIRLYDPSLSQNLFFPYVVHGPRREPTQLAGIEREVHPSGQSIINIQNIETWRN